MITFIFHLIVMSVLLLGSAIFYVRTPFLSQNPLFSVILGILVLVLILCTFPKLINFVIKFILFSITIITFCNRFGYSLDSFVHQDSSPQSIFNNFLGKVSNTFSQTKDFTTRRQEVLSGHTFHLDDQQVQLYGIDTPDLGQTCQNEKGDAYFCGETVQKHLAEMIEGKEIQCEAKGTLNNNQLAKCTLAGEDVAAILIREGWAVADRKQTDLYIEEEDSAHLRKVGLWQGKFIAPWDWRKSQAKKEEQKAVQEKIKLENQKQQEKEKETNSSSVSLSLIKKVIGLLVK